MQLQLDRSALADALHKVKPASGRGYLPIYSAAHIDTTDGVKVTCTNGETTAQAIIDGGRVVSPGVVCVPIGPLLGLVDKALGLLVTLVVDGNTLSIEVGEMRATLNTLDAEQWPKVTMAGGDPLILDSDSLEAIDRVAHAAHQDIASRPGLSVVRLEDGKAIATDSYRMAIAQLGVSGLPAVSIPALSLRAALKTVRPAPVAITADNTCVTICSGDASLSWTLRLITENFPTPDQRSKLIPTKFEHHVTVDRKALLDTLDRVAPMADLDHRDTRKVILEMTDNRLGVSARANEIGEVSDGVDASGSTPGPMRFLPAYLHEMLDAASGDEVTIDFQDEARKPVMVRESGYEELLMPQAVK